MSLSTDEHDEANPQTAVNESRIEDCKAASYSVTDTDGADSKPEDGQSKEHNDFSNLRKWNMLVSVSLLNMISVFATSSILPAAPQAMRDLHVHNDLYLTLLVSIWELGEGVSPFFSAPLSERYGRLPVLHLGNAAATVCAIACALSVNIQMLVGFRFLNGAFLTALTLGPAISGDIFPRERRGTAMAVAAGLQNLGVFIAPVSGGFITQNFGWRWTNWVNAIAIGTIGLLCLLVLRETRRPKRSANRTPAKFISVAKGLARPVKMLFISPTVFLASIYTAFIYGCTFLVATTLTTVLEETYDFSPGAAGLSFLALAVGNVVGMLFYAMTSDRYVRYQEKKTGSVLAEHRLVHMIMASVTSPIGLLLYGWSSAHGVHYMVPLLGVAIIGFSMITCVLATQNYLVDAYQEHSASAVGSGVILRAVSGALLPLAGPPLYQRLGLGWGNSVLALITILFVPALTIMARCRRGMHDRKKLSVSTTASTTDTLRPNCSQ